MSKPWGEHSAEERTAVFKSVAAVYEELGKPAWLKNPKSLDQYVNVLNAG